MTTDRQKVCGLRLLMSYVNGGGIAYTCGLPKDHDGRHKQKIANSYGSPATFSWPEASTAPPVIQSDPGDETKYYVREAYKKAGKPYPFNFTSNELLKENPDDI